MLACVGLVVLTVFLVRLAAQLKPVKPQVEPREPPLAVTVCVIAPTNVADVVNVAGTLEAWATVTVAAEQAGRVTVLTCEEGALMKQGDRLAAVDSRLADQSVRRAELACTEAISDYQRWTNLQRTGSVSEKEFESIANRRAQAEVSLADARVVRTQCEVHSPLDGVVQERFIELGEYLAPGQPVCRLIAAERVKTVFHVAERDVYNLRVGQDLAFTADALPGRTVTGKVHFIAPAAAADSNTFRVELAVDNADGTLRPGLIVRVALVRGRFENVVAVPLDALVPDKGEYVAFVHERGAAVRRVVRLRALAGGLAVVESGLAVGEEVVVSGQRQCEDGRPIAPATTAP